MHRQTLSSAVLAFMALSLIPAIAAAEPKAVQIIQERSEIHHMAVSPDKNRLVYSAREKGKSTHSLKIWTIESRPYKRKKLTQGVGASFAPDSERIVYYSETKGDNRYWVTTIDNRGKGIKDYEVQGLDPSAAKASISPTGKTILFTNRSGSYLVPVAGGEPRQVTTKVLTAPDWHPSAPKVVYERKGGGIAVLDVINGDITNITPSRTGHRPRYSPDGKHVVFMVDFKIYVQEIDTGKRRSVAEGVEAFWSNAGKGLIVLKETGTYTKGQVIDLADLSVTWVALDGSKKVTLMEKAHGATVHTEGRDVYMALHKVGVYHAKLPELPGEAEARKKLAAPMNAVDPDRSDKQPVRKFAPPKRRATDKPIDPNVLKAVQ